MYLRIARIVFYRFIVHNYIVSHFNILSMSNFELSSRLRLFLSIAVQGRCSFIGSKNVYPVSGRGKSAYVSCDKIGEWFIKER